MDEQEARAAELKRLRIQGDELRAGAERTLAEVRQQRAPDDHDPVQSWVATMPSPEIEMRSGPIVHYRVHEAEPPAPPSVQFDPQSEQLLIFSEAQGDVIAELIYELRKEWRGEFKKALAEEVAKFNTEIGGLRTELYKTVSDEITKLVAEVGALRSDLQIMRHMHSRRKSS